MEKHIKLSFVNGGEEFEVPHLTVLLQERLFEDLIELEKKIKDDKKREREYQKILIMRCLNVVDKKVKLKDINNMHPDDFIKLFNMVWTKGRELSGDEKKDFR